MSVQNDTAGQSKGVGQESLAPQSVRIMKKHDYVFAWVGGCVTIGAFMMGAALVPPTGQLNLAQACVAMLLGVTLIAVCMTLNGEPGHKYGIPFIVQARSTFGFAGTNVPGFVRGLPAIFWYGVQSWVGAVALNAVCSQLFGFDNIVVTFLAFQAFQILLSTLGFKGIKWLEDIGSVFIIFALFYMLYILFRDFNTEITKGLIDYPGSWGVAFLVGVATFSGTYTTFLISISDVTRELDTGASTRSVHILHWLGTVPATGIMALVGLLTSNITGSWDPISLFTKTIDNKFVLIVTLLFIAVAQVTTNVLNNVVPPAYVMMNVFKTSYRKATVIIGVLAVCTCPWVIQEASVFQLFVQLYSAFLGPIFVVMVTDYYIIRRRSLNINYLYDADGPYQGVNWQAIIAIAVGAATSFIDLSFSWYISLVPTMLLYIFLMRFCPISKGFLAGSIFEGK